MSAHEQRKQRELAERVGKDKKNQEKLRTDAQKLVEVLRVGNFYGHIRSFSHVLRGYGVCITV